MSTTKASYWEQRKTRKIRGSKVTFYRRYEGGDYICDFSAFGKRIQKSAQTTNLDEAARAAERWLKELWEESTGIAGERREKERAAAPASTVEEIGIALDGGARVFDERTAATYWSSLLRLARVVDADDPWSLRLDVVLSRANVERYFAAGQGRAEVDWKGEHEVNRGLNSGLRNVRSLLGRKACDLKWSREVKLPQLDEFRAIPYLHAPNHGFEPWEPEVYAAMCAAAAALRETRPDLWLVNTLLRRLGLRVEELTMAHRSWIEDRDGVACLVLKDRPDFKLLKNGSARRLTLDPELRAILLEKTGYLIGPPEWSKGQRRRLIEREHSAFLRQFIPDRVKTNHELRMYAGSLIYMRHGLQAAANFLGTTNAVAESYYCTMIGGSPALDAAAVAAV